MESTKINCLIFFIFTFSIIIFKHIFLFLLIYNLTKNNQKNPKYHLFINLLLIKTI